MNELQTITASDKLIALVLDGVTSIHTQRAYKKALTDFFIWYQAQPNPVMNKATVQRYRRTLGGSSSRINQAMSAVKKMAQEAADNGMLDQGLANGVARVHGAKVAGVRSGNWLTKEQAQSILLAPNIATLKGLRDRAILAVMIGAGLRRSEVVALTREHIQQRDGRWVIVDLIGKGQHVRSVPIAPWVKTALDDWHIASAIESGVIFRAIHKGGFVSRETISPQGINDAVMKYAAVIGADKFSAHDCRRTFAKLAKRGGSDIQQIQLSLGHLSSKTTERYLGTEQDLNDAPADRLGLSL